MADRQCHDRPPTTSSSNNEEREAIVVLEHLHTKRHIQIIVTIGGRRPENVREAWIYKLGLCLGWKGQ